MASIDTAFSGNRRAAPVERSAPWDPDAPGILEPPSRLSFPPDAETARASAVRSPRA